MIARIVNFQGTQVGFLAAPPNWDTEITVSLELPTDVSKEPITFNESRRNFAASARYKMSWRSYLHNAADATELRLFLTRIRGEGIVVPLWPDVCELQNAIVAGQTIFTLVDLPARYGYNWVIADEQFEQWEFVTVTALNQTTRVMQLSIGPGNAYPAGTFLYPLILGRLDEQPKPEGISDETMEVDFTIKENSRFSARVTPAIVALQIVGPNIPAFSTTPKWNVQPNHVRPLDWTEMPDVVYEHIGFMRQDQQRVYDHRTPRGQELEFYENNRLNISKIEYFWRDRRATTLRFMIPTYRGDLRMLENTPTTVTGTGTVLIDSYSETHYNTFVNLYNGSITGGAQSFTGDGKPLTSAKFYLHKVNAPPGNIVAKLYTHSGTFGSSSLPTGTALATSNTITASTLTTSLTLVTFTFATPYTLVAGVKYCIALEYNLGDASNYVRLGTDTAAPAHPGSGSFIVSLAWGAYPGYDVIFYVYGTGAITIPQPTWIRCERSFFSNPGRETQPGDPYIALISQANFVSPYQLTSAVDVAPDETRLVATANVATHIASTTIISHLLLARFAEPTLEWTYTTPYLATTRLKFMELPHEYANPPAALPEPAYLFIFTETGIRTDRFTSYENGINVPTGIYAGNYVPAPFSFDTIKTGLKLDQEKLDFKSFKFDGNPLNKMWPFSLDAILTLEIVEVNAANPQSNTAISRFYGDVWSVQSDYSATAVPFGNLFDRKFPRFLLSVSDNYTQFSEPTKITPSAFRIADATINGIVNHTSQTLSINSATAHAKAADYFAGGWLETGIGAQKEKRGILSSAPGTGVIVTLAIDRPLIKAANNQALDLYPGYDGSITECDAKFNNRINFGGHPFIPNINPGVKAMKTKENLGGKKG